MRSNSYNLYVHRVIVFIMLGLVLLTASCGEETEKKRSFEMMRSNTEKAANAASNVLINLANDGVGPYRKISFSKAINTDMAAVGEKKYKAICATCHMTEKRLIGPPLKGIYERRSPAWVMNMIANPNGMLKKDPIAKALLKEYNNAIMLNQNLSKKETRAVAEYLRTL